MGGGVEIPVGALRDGTLTSLELLTPDTPIRGRPCFRVEDVVVLSGARHPTPDKSTAESS